MRAFLFPGQGSQAVGMGAVLAEASASARDVFGEVDEALGQNLFKLMREGPEDELKLTENAQPAIMAHALAVYAALTREGGVRLEKAAGIARLAASVANWTRRLVKNASGATKRASARSRTRSAKAASISRLVLARKT